MGTSNSKLNEMMSGGTMVQTITIKGTVITGIMVLLAALSTCALPITQAADLPTAHAPSKLFKVDVTCW